MSAKELAETCIIRFERRAESLVTIDYALLREEVEGIIKEAAKRQREAIAKELSLKAVDSNMASRIIFESVAHNIAMNTIAV